MGQAKLTIRLQRPLSSEEMRALTCLWAIVKGPDAPMAYDMRCHAVSVEYTGPRELFEKFLGVVEDFAWLDEVYADNRAALRENGWYPQPGQETVDFDNLLKDFFGSVDFELEDV